MGTHLYVCDSGGPMVVAVEGAPPRWVTCAACGAAAECSRCDGAELQGVAPEFAGGVLVAYRCDAGHEKTLRMPAGVALPESAQCTECDGMMLPRVRT